MQKNPADPIKDILEAWRVRGLFTHAHVVAGSLASPTVVVDVAVGPDKARIFDLASLTKALVTAPLAHSLMRSKGLDPFNATIENLMGTWPQDLPDSFKSLRVLDLLRHRSGLPAWRNFWLGRLGLGLECPPGDHGMEQRHQAIIAKMRSLALTFEDTRRHIYSDCGFILLGLALEVATGSPLSKLFDGILGVAADRPTIQFAHQLPTEVAIPSAYCPVRGRLIVGEVHDENCAALGGVCGHAGLFGSASGVAHILRRLYELPVYREFLEINANYLIEKPEQDSDYLYGWRRGSDRGAKGFGGGAAMGHLGFTGTAFWVDWPDKRFAICLTNRVISGRINRAITDLRAEVFTALA